jgi:hypothetical protein
MDCEVMNWIELEHSFELFREECFMELGRWREGGSKLEPMSLLLLFRFMG